MARYIGPVCRQCRREGMKLFLKGERCHTEKCAIEKRNFAPGQHGKDRKPKIVGYGLQLREKQKARRYYQPARRPVPQSVRERQRAPKASPATTCSTCWSGVSTTWSTAWASAPAASQARQLVRHGHLMVNGQQSQHPLVRGQAERRHRSSREKQEQSRPSWLPATPPRTRRSPNWLEVDRDNLKGRVIAQPKREELVQIQLNEQLIVELYSK